MYNTHIFHHMSDTNTKNNSYDTRFSKTSKFQHAPEAPRILCINVANRHFSMAETRMAQNSYLFWRLCHTLLSHNIEIGGPGVSPLEFKLAGFSKTRSCRLVLFSMRLANDEPTMSTTPHWNTQWSPASQPHGISRRSGNGIIPKWAPHWQREDTTEMADDTRGIRGMANLRTLEFGIIWKKRTHKTYHLANQHIYGKSPFFTGKTHHKWPCSIAMINYQRVVQTCCCFSSRVLMQIQKKFQQPEKRSSQDLNTFDELLVIYTKIHDSYAGVYSFRKHDSCGYNNHTPSPSHHHR